MVNKISTSFLIIAILVITQSCEKPVITAKLDYVFPKKDSLIVLVNLQNQSNEALFLVCKVNQIEIQLDNSIQVNYHNSVDEEFKYLKNKSQDFIEVNNEHSSLKDTFYITLPTINKQFQKNHLGNKVDIYDRINNLEEAYYILNRNKLAPEPPKDITKHFYTDIDVYNLVKQKNINDKETSFYQEVIILKPNEMKTFSINASYLLLQKATYLLSFDFKTNDTIFIEEAEILQGLGFKRFKGHIMSNMIEVKSPAPANL